MSENTNRTDKPPSVDRLSELWRRINDHKMVQWSVAYAALAYGTQHAVTLITEAFEWPHAVERVSMLLLALGLPLVMTLAWYHGARASRRISGPELTIISILLVMSSLLFYVFVRPSADLAAPAVQQAGVIAARSAAASPKGAISLAVLPFANLSDDKQQEFFSDGMTDEISGALSKISDLRVVGRASAFQFKGENKDLRAIGQSLGATHLIEGSVRKAGNRVRISAELVQADNGLRVWSESYDRELTDVFAIQEDIARAITTSLRMPLGLKPGENLVNNRNVDSDSYEAYLRAKGLIVTRNGVGGRAEMMQAAALLEGVVAKNPSYAPAWVWLAGSYFLWATSESQATGAPIEKVRALVNELRDKGEADARRAIQLEPDRGGGYSTLGLFIWSRMHLVDADTLFQKMLLLGHEAGEENLAAYAIRIGEAGRVKDSLALLERALIEDPLDPPTITATARSRWLNGDDSAAIVLAKTLRPNQRAPLLSMIYASQGKLREAADALKEITESNSAAATAADLLGKAPRTISPNALPLLPGNLAFVYLYVGAPERMLQNAEREAETGLLGGNVLGNVWHPSFAPARKTERFKTVVKRLGFVDYWRAKEWPPQCHPTTSDDFACE